MEQNNAAEQDYLRSTCDQILGVTRDDDDESDNLPTDPCGLLGDDAESDEEVECTAPINTRSQQRRAFFVRIVALLCACCLSVGGHYATNILGPLKSRLHRELGTSHTEFGLLLAAYSLNSTWTPLVGGVIASQLGTTYTSIMATGVIFLGQLLLLCGDIWGNVRLMALGLFVFGLGVSPLAVVQETIIVRFFKSHGLGISMAFGLIAGKGASFLAARTSYPLTEHFGSRAPFYVATTLAALSVLINLTYISFSKWLIDGAGAELEAPDISEEAKRRLLISLTESQALQKVAEKRKVHLRQITKLGDLFWVYMGLNILCGMIWSPFTHLAANIIETRYRIPEKDAANAASYLLAGPLVLYPLCGFLVDRRQHSPIVIQLLLLSSVLTSFAYFWFVLSPSWTKTPIPGIVSFAIGHGFSPLLLVVLVPKIVASKYISTALGAHKSMEQTGSTLLQTLAGILLDSNKGDKASVRTAFQHLLNAFLCLNVLECCSILFMAFLQYRKTLSRKQSRSRRLSVSVESEELDGIPPRRYSQSSDRDPLLGVPRRLSDDRGSVSFGPTEISRGKVMAISCIALVISAWVLFMVTAWYKLGHGN